MLTSEQWTKAEGYVKAHPDAGRATLARVVGSNDSDARRFLERFRAGETAWPGPRGKAGKAGSKAGAVPDAPDKAGAAAAKPGVSLRDFLGRFDFEAKLRRTVRDMCSDRFVSDADIRNACDIPVASFKTVASLPEFQACQLKEGGTVWWSSKENVDTVRAKARKWGISK